MDYSTILLISFVIYIFYYTYLKFQEKIRNSPNYPKTQSMLYLFLALSLIVTSISSPILDFVLGANKSPLINWILLAIYFIFAVSVLLLNKSLEINNEGDFFKNKNFILLLIVMILAITLTLNKNNITGIQGDKNKNNIINININ